jgi:hypothetical protein
LWSTLHALAAQASPAPGPAWQDVLGPYGALVLCLGAILWLTRQLTAERKANRELSDRLVDQAERMIPVMTANTAELERRRRQ